MRPSLLLAWDQIGASHSAGVKALTIPEALFRSVLHMRNKRHGAARD